MTPDEPHARTADGDDPVLRIIPGDADGADAPGVPDADAAVRDPGRALRVATTVRGVLDELRGTEPGPEVRDRLAALHDRTLQQLGELVSDDLRVELDELALERSDGVTAPELRVVLAEIVGWLEGLFHGLSSALVDTDDDADDELPSRSGHYL